ncbi:hypothetical protein [uncultured Secundilactobacillus sp.]|uniref:hypothetical protein n=1 Tax=uncultured Secundilactobacillus sp. TaxID=2813935 RepID=UPI00258850D4|nr:hypothetical protein [uncultured Secundilactobacillus sp.]
MALHYVKTDEKNFVIQNALKLAEGEKAEDYKQVTVATADEIDFNQNFQVYQIDENGVYTRGGKQAVTLAELNQAVADAKDTIDKQEETIKKQADTIKQLQAMAVESAKARATDATTIQQLKDMAVEMTKQLAAFQKTAVETTTDTKEGEK